MALVLLLAHAAFGGSSRSRSAAARHVLNDKDRADLSSVSWPLRGQVALVLGSGRPAASPHEQELRAAARTIAQVARAEVAGSETRFIAEINAEAHSLGMDHTIYTDPSGFDPRTVSTAAGQLPVFERAMRLLVFRQIVSLASVTLPIAGTLTNYNPLIADGYAGKAGSDFAAGGCLALFTPVTVGGRRLTAVGVVIGQGQGSDTSVILAAAGDSAMQLVESVVRRPA